MFVHSINLFNHLYNYIKTLLMILHLTEQNDMPKYEYLQQWL